MRSFGSSVPGSSSSVSSVADPIHLDCVSHSSASSRRPFSQSSILLLIAAAILFAAYALGYLPQFGSLLGATIRSGQTTAIPSLSPAFYGIAGLIAFLLLLALFRSVVLLLRRLKKISPLANRPEKSLAEFVQEATAAKISSRVAREGYHLLQPCYPQPMCIDLTDLLRDDLGLEEEQIGILDAKLLARCDRRDLPSETAGHTLSKLVTVLDLLVRVESAVPAQAERPSGIRARSTDHPAPLTVQRPSAQRTSIPSLTPQNARSQQSRNPTSAQRKAIHAAALHAIESRSLRIANTSGLHRRSSDYEGPRRRETDKPSNSVSYQGPYRRVTDQMAAQIGASSSERKSELDPGELNRMGPILVPPRTPRGAEPGNGN